MVVIGVLSDTHLNALNEGFTSLFEPNGLLGDCTAMLHAGDFTSSVILDYLEDHFNFHGVQGNMDDYDIRRRLPMKKIITLEGNLKIGITHGWGAPLHLAKRVYESFEGHTLDCIVFGHSHIPKNDKVQNVLMFNPGSFKRGNKKKKGSVGKLFVENGKLRGEIYEI